MDNLFDKAEDIDLSEEDIRDITKGKCNILSYEQLEGVNNIDEILGVHNACILLYETRQNFGHWVALHKVDNQTIEFFDSYGFAPDEELKYATYNDTPYLTPLMKKSNYKFIYNNVKLQVFASDVNTCGRWTATRIAMRSIPLATFQKLFKRVKYYRGDWFVSAMTYLYTFDK